MENNAKSLALKITEFQEKMLNVEIIKSKKGYGYSYADLDSIINTIQPILRECGIGYYHYTDFDSESQNNIVATVLYNLDATGDNIVSKTLIDRTVQLAKMNAFMVEGSAITYFRRYHLSAMLGLLTDEDSDAGGKRQPSKATPTTSNSGRSVEQAAPAQEVTDYVAIFENFVKNKSRDKVEKTLKMYKSQISNEDLVKIEKLIKDTYEN